MKEILLTSSVLILALLALRAVFRIPRRAQYALWALVLVRLLVPFSLPALEHNVLTAAEPVINQAGAVYMEPMTERVDAPPEVDFQYRTPTEYQHVTVGIPSPDNTRTFTDQHNVTHKIEYRRQIRFADLLRPIWYAGMAVMAAWFLVSNLRFWRKLRKARVPYIVENCRYPVYLVDDGLPSPCLFGRSIYLTTAAVASPETLRHVIAHESTHARHLDPLWALLRCVCLTVYWFDPLVWVAAHVSKTDCELACDECVLRVLGDGERLAYGRTLLSLIPVRKGTPLLSATTMTAGKKQLRDRITRIAENQQTRAVALFAVIALAALVCAVTFTGAKTTPQTLGNEELAYFNQLFFENDVPPNLPAQFLTSAYEQPEDIDLFALFYNGTGIPGAVSDEELDALKALGFSLDTDLEKLPTADIDSVLREYTGVPLEKSRALWLDQFLYLSEYDAYYHLHDGTNAPTGLSFLYGEREGKLVRLYYDAGGLRWDGIVADGWACVTLEERPKDTDAFPFFIVSNRLEAPPSQALTGEELAYFNEEFFNGEDFNIRNQFLTSLYPSPQDIDLFALFYCGTGLPELFSDPYPSIDELRQLGALDAQGEEIFPAGKLSADAMSAVLLANTGLTLKETNKIGLDSFARLPQYKDTYYYTHGDTNYFDDVQIAVGERIGDLLRLYYPDSNARYPDCDWLCVTLREQPDGGYWFVSNLPCESPRVGTVYPDWDPALTIPLDSLKPYEPETMAVTRRQDDCAERGVGFRVGDYDTSVRVYRSTDGNTYAAVMYDQAAGRDGMIAWDAGTFFTFPGGTELSEIRGEFFHNLFGREGLALSYPGQIGANNYNTINDYYTFSEDGTPSLLARAYGETFILDLDGDGNNELAAAAGSTAQLFFQRDGYVRRAMLEPLLTKAWPEAEYTEFGWWDVNSKALPFHAQVSIQGYEEDPAVPKGTAYRQLYFDGDSLLVYKDERPVTDHVAAGVQAPEDVLDAAKAYVLAEYEAEHEGSRFVDGDFVPAPLVFDDWRILNLDGPDYETPGDLNIEVWNLTYELHTTTPDTVVLAGGRYITEDCWVSPGYPGCDYFYFLVDENGDREYLFTKMENDCSPGTETFLTDLVYMLEAKELLALSDLEGQDLLDIMESQPASFLNRLAEEQTEAEQTAVLNILGTYLFTNSSVYDVQQQFQSCQSYVEVFAGGLTPQGRALWERLLTIAEEGTAPAAAFDAPEEVVITARLHAQSALLALQQTEPGLWDASRIASLERVTGYGDTNLPVEVYRMRADFHAAGAVNLYGGMTELENGWVGGVHMSPYLVFLVENGTYRELPNEIAFDYSPDSSGFKKELNALLAQVTPRFPPTEAELHEAILSSRRNATDHTFDFCAEAHHTLDEVGGGKGSYTFYLMVGFYTYDLVDGHWQSPTGGNFPAAVTFTAQDGRWVLSEYWEPTGGSRYEADIRAKFTPRAVKALPAEGDSTRWDDLHYQCDEAAVQYFAQATGQVPAKVFTKADAEFSGQALDENADEMTYEERLDWVRTAEYDGEISYVPTHTYAEHDGYLAYTGQWVGTPHMDQYTFTLRLPDGTTASLPLPNSSFFGSALPDSMAFRDGKFVYDVVFADELLESEGQRLIHLKGTYHYEVDLTARTVSLTVL